MVKTEKSKIIEEKCWKQIREDKKCLQGMLPCGTQEHILDALLDLDNRIKELLKVIGERK